MRVIKNKKIYDATQFGPSERFACAPSVVLLSDLTVLCSFKIGSAKISSDDSIIIMRSSDKVNEWNIISKVYAPVIDGCPGSIHSFYISEISSGRLLASCCWVDRQNPFASYCNPETGGILKTRCLISESNDFGMTWTEFRELDFGWHNSVSPTGKILKISNGDLVLPYESWKSWNQPRGNYTAAALLSRDEGATWSWPVIMATDPFENTYYWDNRLALNPGDNTLQCLVWARNKNLDTDLPIHSVQGSSDALYWTRPISSTLLGQSACPLFVDKGLLAVYADRRKNCGRIKISLSLDAGRTWVDELVIAEIKSDPAVRTVYDGCIGGPDVSQLPNGDIITVYYSGKNTHLDIEMAIIKI